MWAAGFASWSTTAKLLVEYRKNHAYYSIAEAARPKRQVIEFLPDGSVRETFI